MRERVVDQALIIPPNYIRQLLGIIAFVQEFELCKQLESVLLTRGRHYPIVTNNNFKTRKGED